MASKWTVRPDTRKLELEWTDEDGNVEPFWIDVKKHLTVGEEKRSMTAGFRSMSTSKKAQTGAKDEDAAGSTEIQVDWQAQSFARTETYLTDWSLLDEKNVKLKLCREVIESLHPGVFKVIEDGITAHVEAMEQEKKRKGSGNGPQALSA